MDEARRRLAEGALFTDQYQLTMAQLLFRRGLHETTARFDAFYRSNPDYGSHQAGFCVQAGMAWLLDWMEGARFGEAEVGALAAQRGPDGAPVFEPGFLDWLRDGASFERLRLRAIPEGRVVHPRVPLVTVEGPLALCQLLETSLLARLGYPTLVATKAARVAAAARGAPVLEFGMRRGHDEGANAGGRAALIGGATGTSNAGLAAALGLQPSGTHAHSLVQAFLALGMGELDAFRAYAEVYPASCLLLVDTIDTLGSGIPNAIRVFEELRARGFEPAGVRLDSGDLAWLSIRAARMLDDAGFERTPIVLSSELDELVIWQILDQIREDAPEHGVDPDALCARLVYGVGTRLITSAGAGSLGLVYKLAGVEEGGELRPAVKLSDSVAKATLPGAKSAWRVYDARGRATADLISLEGERPDPAAGIELLHPGLPGESRRLAPGEAARVEPLLEPVPTGRQRAPDALDAMRERRDADLAALDAGVRRLVNPHVYHVSITPALARARDEAIDRALGRGGAGPDAG